ncbi:MAG: radical SAM protein [Polyangiaceae bacterium]|nr:radical SAM protein [Polyangiaceae bacterium]MCW5792114.1 radical SAM protein [Polyangiaceae bacterium]
MSRRRLDVLSGDFFPAYVVWELTLRCDHACAHCGSRASKARPDELSTEEALRVVSELAALGAREVVLIGGEAYLHSGFLQVVQALAEAGIHPTLTTGGRGVTAELARAMHQAGLLQVSVSVDGLQATHDRMRRLTGSFRYATAALEHCREAGIRITANTNVNRLNQADLEPLFEHLQACGITAWQVQLTAPLGRAADRTELILQPWELLDLMPRVAALKRRAYAQGILLLPGNNLGYFGEEEALLRSTLPNGRDHFSGCQAGRYVLGVESNGAVKGCPSLQTAAYVGGNLRQRSLRALWESTPELASMRSRTVEALWGFCRSCDFAATCLGGCSFTAHALLGRPGNNPYCHYRARVHARQGVRERLVPVVPASGQPFDNGRFEIVVEPADAPLPAPLPAEQLVQLSWGKQRSQLV